jgi:HTH-type transcriptional regulator/antitoxin HigA
VRQAGEGKSFAGFFCYNSASSSQKRVAMDDLHASEPEASYERVLKEIACYFEREPEPGTPEGGRFDRLAALIEAYEDVRYSISGPDLIGR